MNISQIISALKIADPQNGAGYQERKNALEMARKAMDNQGLSYASLGCFNVEDAERIENQFSVSTGHERGHEGKSRTGFKWNPFRKSGAKNKESKQDNTVYANVPANSGNSKSSDFKWTADMEYKHQENMNGYWNIE